MYKTCRHSDEKAADAAILRERQPKTVQKKRKADTCTVHMYMHIFYRSISVYPLTYNSLLLTSVAAVQRKLSLGGPCAMQQKVTMT